MRTNMFKNIKDRVAVTEELYAIEYQTKDCFLNALCSAIESNDKKLAENVSKIIRNRVIGGSLISEDQEIVNYIESFRKPLEEIFKILER